MIMKTEGDDQNEMPSGQTDATPKVHEALRLKKYFAILNSDEPVKLMLDDIKPLDDPFKEYKDLMKTAVYKKHSS